MYKICYKCVMVAYRKIKRLILVHIMLAATSQVLVLEMDINILSITKEVTWVILSSVPGPLTLYQVPCP